jgi:PHD/YefM family antitoxin component YafN of YafNO toxin-antitoxin module
MNETITREQAKIVLPKLMEQTTFNGTVTIEDKGKPFIVVMDAAEYARLLTLQRKAELRATLLREWERKTSQPDWDKAFERFETLSQRLATIDEEILDEALDEAVTSVRSEKKVHHTQKELSGGG